MVASTDVEFNWREVNSTEYSICIGASMPVGLYVQKYPAAMQRGELCGVCCAVHGGWLGLKLL